MDKSPCRVVLCIGLNCNADRRADPLFERLKSLLGYPNPFIHSGKAVKWEVAGCLKHCDLGPNIVIYPDELWFHGVDEAGLERLIEEEIAPRL